MAEITEAQVRQLAREEFNGGSRCQLGIRNEEKIRSLDREVTEVKGEITDGFKIAHERITEVKNDIKWYNRWMIGTGLTIILMLVAQFFVR